MPAIQSSTSIRELRLGVALAGRDQLLNGNGTPPNMIGIARSMQVLRNRSRAQ